MSKVQLDLIDLDQPLPGQRKFISCWVCRSPGVTFIVDPGPRSTAVRLIERIHDLGVEQLDYILLTHIHLDHAGGTAEICAAFPDARVVCHHKGGRHLLEPERLWEGSLAVLGKFAEVYGQPTPLPVGVLEKPAVLAQSAIQVIQTPGHAPHHLCYVHDHTLFSGEAAGTFAELADGNFYLRPATPPRFHLEVALASLDRLLQAESKFERIAFGHHGYHGCSTSDCHDLLQIARDQLLIWVETARNVLKDTDLGTGEVGSQAKDLKLLDETVSILHKVDPQYANLKHLPQDIQERETQFTRQTLRGIIGYLNPQFKG